MFLDSPTCTLVTCPAQKNRWDEELTLVKHEMERTTWHRADEWKQRFHHPEVGPGPKAYAAWMAAQWSNMALDANQVFKRINREYQVIIM
jgi:hypothetical protein